MKRLIVVALFAIFALPASAASPRVLAPLDWWPVWSPNASHIAFTRVFPSRMELHSLDLRSGRSVRIASNAGQLGPTWSSDGARLAYSSGGVLWTVNANGSGKRRYAAPARSFAPAWQPGTAKLAYLTTHGAKNTDLWVAGVLWARNAIGTPAWSPDGAQLAFQRDDGIYVAAGPGSERRLVAIDNPGSPVWSRDGSRIAYPAHQTLWTIRAAGGTPVNAAPSRKTWPLISTPSWSDNDTRIVFSWAGGVFVARVNGGGYAEDRHERVVGAGAAFAPTSYFVVYSASRPACPGHVALHRRGVGGSSPTLTGSCTIAGTSKADVIEGTPLWGDVILAGAGNDRIHANDGHTDRVDCGPGRDVVWADRTDRLTACEVVHR